MQFKATFLALHALFALIVAGAASYYFMLDGSHLPVSFAFIALTAITLVFDPTR